MNARRPQATDHQAAVAVREPDAAPAAYRLTAGAWSTLVTATGEGSSSWDGLLLARGAESPRPDSPGGWFFHLRDVESGAHASVGRQPAGGSPERYAFDCEGGVVRIARTGDGLEALLEIGLAPDEPAELRRLTLWNRGSRARTIEVTSVLEVALQSAAADRAHPAFSKLFVQTGRDPASGALFACRRPRAADERWPVLAHGLSGPGPLEVETDRARFLGRGRAPSRPAALDGPLSGTLGDVLDPVFAARRIVRLAPGASAVLEAVLTVGEDVDRALERVRACSAPGRLDAAFARGGEVAVETIGATRAESPEPDDDARGGDASASPAPGASLDWDEPLDCWNGVGGFAADGCEYVIRLAPRPDGTLALPPRPWCNVIANERFGCLVSETGNVTTWSGNSREHRLTPWSNDPVLDPHGEAIYLRDEETGAFWSPLPGPAPLPIRYETRHGFGCSTFRVAADVLSIETTLFVPRHDPVRIARVTVSNLGTRSRRLSLFGWQRLVLGTTPEESAAAIRIGRDDDAVALLAWSETAGPASGAVAFATVVGGEGLRARLLGGDREAFLGDGGVAAPRALRRPGPLAATLADGECAGLAQQAVLEVPAGASATCAFLLGEGASHDEALALLRRYGGLAAIDRALEETRAFWSDTLSAVRVETPEPAIDLMVNGWLLYQTIACRLWGRTAFYQSGGAFGFRDQLQDASALLAVRPDLTRAQILLHAAHQFVEGDVLHWWHPPDSRGLRTRFADDLLWLPWVTAGYVEWTGDRKLLDEVVPWLEARGLEPGEDEAFLAPTDSGARGDLYAHCCRAIDRSLTTGAHGLPLFGSGDWNDGMNRVGREGRGESVWMGFFLCDVIGRFLPLCEARGDAPRAERYRAHREALRAALEDAAWDGAWYRRGWYDDGAPLGSAESDECRIDALVQAWSVLSGAAPAGRAAAAMDAVEQQLVSERDGLVRLLAPPFDRTPHDPGYIKGYLPGVRENGGQYTHAALWVVRALAELGRHDRAGALLAMLSPVSRAAAGISTYEVEPYVVAADVYGEPPHVGRGGWTWYTGSAGWAFRVAVETVLGVRIEGGRTMVVRPRIPSSWPGFRLGHRLQDGTRYELVVEQGPGRGVVVEARLDGIPVPVVDGAARLPLARDGGVHRVELRLA